MGDKGRQDTGTHVGRQWETKREDKTSKGGTPSNTSTSVGRQWETIGSMGDKGRQDLGKADTPSNTGTHVGTMRTIQIRHTCVETMGEFGEQLGTRGDQGDKTSKRRARHPRKGNKKRGGRQWKTTRRDKTLGRRTHRPTQTYVVGRPWETRGDKTSGRRKRHQADIPSQAHMWGVTMGDTKGRQDVVKADKPSNTGTRVRRQWETMGDNRFNGRHG